MIRHDSITARYFASNLRRLRAMHKLTLAQVAEAVQVKSKSAVSRWEQPGSEFRFPDDLAVVDRLASLYQVKIADLFTPEGATEKQLKLGGSIEDAIYIVNRKIQNGEIKMLLSTKDAGFPVPSARVTQ